MLTEAEGCGVVINEIVAIKEALGRARVWQEAARKLQARSSTRGTVEKATLDELTTLLSQGEALEVVCPDIPYLAQSLRAAEEWQRRAEAALDAQPHAVAGGSSGEEKAVKALEDLHVQGDAVTVMVPVGRTLRLRLWRRRGRWRRRRR